MSKHNVTLIFEDGRAVNLFAEEEDNIYFACLKNKIRILTDCLEGACATCKAVCTSGTYFLDEYTEEALTKEEIERGEVLTCQMHVTSNCVIEFPYESSVSIKSEPKTHSATVSKVEMVSSNVAQLVLAGRPSEMISFLPGQYVHLSIPGTEEYRSYSFANASSDAKEYIFYIKLIEGGGMSKYLSNAAQIGDEILISGPFGRFYLRPVERPVLLLAGGTGLAPMLSILDTMVMNNKAEFPVQLLYGANRPEELFGMEQISTYKERGLKFNVEYSVVEEGSDWPGSIGHVTDLLRDDLLNKGNIDIYLCGPPPMVNVAENWLISNGVKRSLVFSEKFVPS